MLSAFYEEFWMGRLLLMDLGPSVTLRTGILGIVYVEKLVGKIWCGLCDTRCGEKFVVNREF